MLGRHDICRSDYVIRRGSRGGCQRGVEEEYKVVNVEAVEGDAVEVIEGEEVKEVGEDMEK